MFYSQLLLSKKGALGTVWIAAHCYKKLKKSQVQQTDICSSVDKILVDEVPVVAHRILAFLLLGVVRIYSKKVEYLFHDCNDVFKKLCEFKIGKRTPAGSSASRPRGHSISLPKRFELDTFDLGILEDPDLVGGNARPLEEVTLADDRRREGSMHGSLNEENMSSSEAHSTAYTPPRDVLSAHHVDHDSLMSPLRNINNSTESLEILRGTSFALEDRLEPMMLNEAEEEQMHDKSSNMDRINLQWLPQDMEHNSVVSPSCSRHDSPRLEIFHETGFSLEDRLEPMVLDEAEEEQMNGMLSNDNLRTDVPGKTCDLEFVSVASSSRVKNPPVACLEKIHASDNLLEHCRDPNILSKADEPHNFPVSVDEEQHVAVKKMKFPEMITPENRLNQRKEHSVSISVDVTPDIKLAEAGAGTPDFAAVQTPALQERAKNSKKRKVLLDYTTVVPNNEYKDWINDPRDLKRKKRTVPHTHLHIWRAHKLCHIPQSFLEPLIPSIPIDLHSLERKKKTRAPPSEPSKSSATQNKTRTSITLEGRENTQEVGPSNMHEDKILDDRSAEDKTPDAQSPIGQRSAEQTSVAPGTPIRQRSPEQTSIAPGTPIDQRSAEQTSVAPGTPVTTHFYSLRSHKTGAFTDSDILVPASSLEILEKRPSPSEELDMDEINSSERDSIKKNAFSARTRMAASYLQKKFLEKKRRKVDEALNLSQLLVGKSKRESARLFYETLVLKTRDCLDVQQEKAYGDILLRETSKLMVVFEI